MSNPANMRSIFSTRRVRIVVALLLIGLSIWGLAPYVAYRVSSSAFINAEMMRVTAPIPGYLSSELPHKGEFIDRASKLTLIRSYAVDRRRLVELETQQSAAKERLAFDNKQLTEIASLDSELEKRTRAYREGMITRLGHEITEAEAESAGCLKEDLHRRDIGTRLQGLVESGGTSQIRSAEALAVQEATATKCAMAAARAERLKAELASLQNGIFLQDATNDVPYSQQQRERLFLRRQELEADADQQRERTTRVAAEIAEEQRRVNSLEQYNLTLPPDHVVWSVPASPGSVVTEGQTVLDLADCDHRFVAVELPEREFENIKPGDPASVRLIGSDAWRLGHVQQIRGSAARADDRLLAAQVPTPTNGSITVEVSLTQDGPAANSSYCDIGRLAEVRFQRAAPAFVDSAKELFWAFVDLFRPTEKVARQ
jgi:multidrug resistance efflux pump